MFSANIARGDKRWEEIRNKGFLELKKYVLPVGLSIKRRLKQRVFAPHHLPCES